MKPIKPVYRPPLIYHSVQDAIRNYIIDNTMHSGDMLPAENELARQLGVSCNSVREAVRSLELLGMIETRRGSGLYVSDFSFEPILENLPYHLMTDLRGLSDLLQVRRVLETGMIETAMNLMTGAQKNHLSEMIEAMRLRAEQGETFAPEDREFHGLLFELLDNIILTRVLDIFWQTFNRASRLSPIWDADPGWTYQAHKAIVDAILANDPLRAREALDEHYSGLEGRLARLQAKHDLRESE